MTAVESTQRWVQDFVVRLGLCPFAARPLRAGKVRYLETEVQSAEESFYWTAGCLQDFVGEPRERVETTLLIFPNGFAEFPAFLDFVEEIEDVLASSGAESFVQLAHFHPAYCFADLQPADPANATNRSPHPILQLLRVEGVAEAVADYPEVESIPERNISLLRRMASEK
ncbi:MAG: DUF1415 domain-containing protein [Lewinella sp.]